MLVGKEILILFISTNILFFMRACIEMTSGNENFVYVKQYQLNF